MNIIGYVCRIGKYFVVDTLQDVILGSVNNSPCVVDETGSKRHDPECRGVKAIRFQDVVGCWQGVKFIRPS